MSSTTSSASDIITNLANLLPTGTFLTFQTIVPLFSNDGSCGSVEKVMTSILMATFMVICFVLVFTDSITTSSGKIYFGVVTTKGLFNPQFQGSGIPGVTGSFYTVNPSYFVTIFDLINAILSVTVFATLSLLTLPVSTCFFASLPSTISKSVPVLVGILAVIYFSFSPTPRRGIGFALTGMPTIVQDSSLTTTTTENSSTSRDETAASKSHV